jgi:hypothetical protein
MGIFTTNNEADVSDPSRLLFLQIHRSMHLLVTDDFAVTLDAADQTLSANERLARSFVRMCMRHDYGERIFFNSADFPEGVVRRGIELLLAEFGLRAEAAAAQRRRGSSLKFDSYVVLSVPKPSEFTSYGGRATSDSLEAAAARNRFQRR